MLVVAQCIQVVLRKGLRGELLRQDVKTAAEQSWRLVLGPGSGHRLVVVLVT